MQREAGVPAVAVQVAEAVVILVVVLSEVVARRVEVGGWGLVFGEKQLAGKR